MNLNETIEKIREIKGVKIADARFAEAFNCTRENISRRIKRNSRVKDDEIKKLEEYFKVNLSTLSEQNYVDLTDKENETLQTIIKEDRELLILFLKAYLGDEKAKERLKKIL